MFLGRGSYPLFFPRGSIILSLYILVMMHRAKSYILQITVRYVQNYTDREDANVLDALLAPFAMTQKPDTILYGTFQ